MEFFSEPRNFKPDYRYTLNFIDAWSIDEIVILDITRDKQSNRGIFFETVDKFAKNCFVPLSVGESVFRSRFFKTSKIWSR